LNCPECEVQLRKLSQKWHEDKTNTLCREVICDIERGGCGHSFWYEKEYTSITRNMATKQIITMEIVQRKARIHACADGEVEVTPCTCEGAEPHPNYLNEHRMIPECIECGNHRVVRKYR